MKYQLYYHIFLWYQAKLISCLNIVQHRIKTKSTISSNSVENNYTNFQPFHRCIYYFVNSSVSNKARINVTLQTCTGCRSSNVTPWTCTGCRSSNVTPWTCTGCRSWNVTPWTCTGWRSSLSSYLKYDLNDGQQEMDQFILSTRNVVF